MGQQGQVAGLRVAGRLGVKPRPHGLGLGGTARERMQKPELKARNGQAWVQRQGAFKAGLALGFVAPLDMFTAQRKQHLGGGVGLGGGLVQQGQGQGVLALGAGL
ncbi:MAG: hypothetical protein C4K60_11860 [Ideonella sp. MAG2]|nr:MAG: hypothetical protein C4K60_11860 [Ideonella sp. MAG2]